MAKAAELPVIADDIDRMSWLQRDPNSETEDEAKEPLYVKKYLSGELLPNPLRAHVWPHVDAGHGVDMRALDLLGRF